MAARLQKTPLLILPLLAAVIAIGVLASGIAGSALTSESAVARSGRLSVGGVTYRFAPTTCTITDEDFVAAGSGTIDDQTFWVSATADGVDLEVGPESEIEVPAEDQLWLRSVDEITWTASGGEIEASTLMRDERRNRSDSMPGALTVTCPLA